MTTTTAPTAEAGATLALAHKFLDAINTRNVDALLETVSEDATYELRVAPTPTVGGHDGFRLALAALDATWRHYNFVTDALYVDGAQFVAEWTMTGTLAQRMPVGTRTAVPDGRVITFKGCDICPVANGKVTAKISYVDATAWYELLTFEAESS
jgi:ketosteroid isomerase-like protein